ncbi:MAG: ABC transporter substrate-binding protein [Chloroflexi bacterium]|nr:ABC transporter substrate-binding protein [Chloroflexota bacterium]MCL5109186.1 ABC transporter substrate-binding protein [Chloroflexota bacterium]
MDTNRASSGLPLTRRGFLRLSAIAAVPLLAACAPATPAPAPTSAPPAAKPAGTTAAAQPSSAITRGGTVTQALNWTYPTMDPHLTTIQYMTGYEAMYNGLVRFELVDAKTWEHKLVPDLAESWSQPDPKTIELKLKQGVKFHDGSDFTAEVAAWNLLRARDHEKSQKKTQLVDLDTATAADKNTLVLKLKVPNPAFLRSMAFVVGARIHMMSKVAHDKLGDDGFARAPVGTGAFKFKQWVTDDRLILDRNPDYFEKGADGKQLPYLDGFVGRYVPDPTVALTDMKAGTVQVLEWVATKDVAAIKADPNMGIVEMPWAGQVYFMVGFNTEAKPFSDVRVRQAALMGIDRDGMAKALGFGVGTPHFYPDWAKGSLGYDESIPKNEYNPAKVKQLLTEAGYPNGVEIELKVIAREPENTIGEFVQQMWSAVGIKTKLVAQERLSWIDAVRAKNFQSCFWRGTFVTTVDPDLLGVRIRCGGSSNWAQFCDKDIDRLMNEGASTQDEKKRHEIYKQVLTLIQERAYLGTGIQMPLVTAYRKDLQGMGMNYQVPDFRAAWLKK